MVSDQVGRKPVLYAITIGMFVLAWPLWWLMHQPALAAILTGQAGFAALLGLTAGVAPATMSEMLPARVRCMAVGIGYNVTMALFGGTVPLIATYLVARTADDFMPAYYMMGVAALFFMAGAGAPGAGGHTTFVAKVTNDSSAQSRGDAPRH